MNLIHPNLFPAFYLLYRITHSSSVVFGLPPSSTTTFGIDLYSVSSVGTIVTMASSAFASLPAALQPKEEDIQMMLSAGVHTGTRNSDSQMTDYIWRRRNDGVHILNIGKTWEKLMLAARVIVAIENPEDVIAISARPYGMRATLKYGTCLALVEHLDVTRIANFMFKYLTRFFYRMCVSPNSQLHWIWIHCRSFHPWYIYESNHQAIQGASSLDCDGSSHRQPSGQGGILREYSRHCLLRLGFAVAVRGCRYSIQQQG